MCWNWWCFVIFSEMLALKCVLRSRSKTVVHILPLYIILDLLCKKKFRRKAQNPIEKLCGIIELESICYNSKSFLIEYQIFYKCEECIGNMNGTFIEVVTHQKKFTEIKSKCETNKIDNGNVQKLLIGRQKFFLFFWILLLFD